MVGATEGNGAACDGITDCIACRHRICMLLPPAHKAQHRHLRDLERGDRLDLHGGGGCLQMRIVLSGSVAICTSFEDGRRQIVSLEMPGDLFCGLSAADVENGRIEALAPSRVCEIDLSPIADTLRGNPRFSIEMFQLTHRELESAAAHITVLGRLDSMERLCLFLADMAWRIGVGEGASRRVSLPLSREDIADYLGLNSETISRVFSRIKKAGLVTFLTPTDYVVPDIHALQSRLPVSPPHGRPRHYQFSRNEPPPMEAELS